MNEFFSKLLDTSDYPPRWTCGNWTSFEGWLHIISDSLIFLAYFAIPASLFVLIRRRHVEFPLIAWLFVAFILFCGLTHAIEAGIFWWPVYRLSGLAKFATAIVSVFTALVVVRTLPEAIALPSVRRAHADLEAALVRERALAHDLESARRAAEQRTSQLAVREHRMRAAASAAKACFVAWEADSGRIVWEIGFAEAMRGAGLSWNRDLTHWSQLIGEQGAAALRSVALDSVSAHRCLYRRLGLLGSEGVWDLFVSAKADPPVKGEPATLTGVFGVVPTADSTDG